jgi:ABC-type branched-subunit amino acid transport system substrate-binding protein
VTRRTRRFGSVLTAVVLGLSGCGSTSGNTADPSGAAPGVTEKPCPHAVNHKHGCIYLGSLSDLTVGPFMPVAVPVTRAQQAFWNRVNQQGGIGHYDIDVTTYLRDNKYDVATQKQRYHEIKDKVLAFAQTLGSSPTAAILPELRASKTVAVPVSWSSQWSFEDNILESGASYCFESMNSVDYAVDAFEVKNVMALHYPGDYGGDAAAGAKIAARAHKLSFTDQPTGQGKDKQSAAVNALVKGKPDLVIMTTGPADAATIVAQAYARGFRGHYIGTSPAWTKELLNGPAGPALKAQYLVSGPWKPFATDSPGHTAMRAALGQINPSDSYTSGWAFSYPLKALLQKAAANKGLTRAGVLDALKGLTTIDYEGMLPAEAGNFAGSPNITAFRQTVIERPASGEYTGTKVVKDFFVGPTAQDYELKAPCYRQSATTSGS